MKQQKKSGFNQIIKSGLLVAFAFIGSLLAMVFILAGVATLNLPHYFTITLIVVIGTVWLIGIFWLFINNEALK